MEKGYPNAWQYSPGTSAVMANAQIQKAIESGAAFAHKTEDGQTIIECKEGGTWFIVPDYPEPPAIPTAMMGAICGDVAGSVYEHHNIKYRLDEDRLIHPKARFTDDTVMTCAVAEGIHTALSHLPKNWTAYPDAESIIYEQISSHLHSVGRKYPRAGYGRSFLNWLASFDRQPYNSWGNGSAMRASYAGWIASSLEEAEKLGEISAKVTHNHPEGIKGAVAVAGCIYMLRSGADKKAIYQYASSFYNLDFSLDEIRDTYSFDVSCMGSVPHAIRAFLEGESFSDVISRAISIGGDSDTIAAIAGSLAEVIYPIPQKLRGSVIDRLDQFLLDTIRAAVDFAHLRHS